MEGNTAPRFRGGVFRGLLTDGSRAWEGERSVGDSTVEVTEHFHHLVKDKSRTVDQIYSKWNDMNSSMKKWNGFYQQASMNRKSGEGDEQVGKSGTTPCKMRKSEES
ncbi:hypothetical protein R6Q57_027054 [Mikania cordata]